MEPDRRCLSRLDAIKGVVRRDAMGLGLRNLGAVRRCCDAFSTYPSAHFHRSVATTALGGLCRTLAGKIAEIWRLWISRGQVSIMVSTFRTCWMPPTSVINDSSMSLAAGKLACCFNDKPVVRLVRERDGRAGQNSQLNLAAWDPGPIETRCQNRSLQGW